MTGSELSKAALHDSPVRLPEDPCTSESDEIDVFASTIAACLGQPAPPQQAPIGLPFSKPDQAVPGDWRPSVEPLTPGCAAHAQSTTPTAGTSEQSTLQPREAERIQVRVTSEELGEIALVIERLDDGLRVVLGAVSPRAIAALRAESRAVRQALENEGRAISSLEIVRMDGLGTNLAQPKVTTSGRTRKPQEPTDSGESRHPHKRRSKRLDLIG